MKLYTDASQTQICYLFEGCQAIIIDLPKKATVNEAEYLAIIAGLEAVIRLRWKDITVLSDSQLAVNQLNARAKTKKLHLKTLRTTVLSLARTIGQVEFKWVERETNLAGIDLHG